MAKRLERAESGRVASLGGGRSPLAARCALPGCALPDCAGLDRCTVQLPYPHGAFTSGTVIAFDVQDHTPPTMEQFVAFLNRAAIEPELCTLAIHCRGGKGRTGCMLCGWLLYTRYCDDADDALTLFALERTELGLGRKKLQGVDTPSQRRYVHQVAALLASQAAYHPRAPASGTAPSSGAGIAHAVASGAASVSGGAEPYGGAVPAPEASSGAVPRPISIAPPMRPTIHLTQLQLNCWFAQTPPANLVVALHTEASAYLGSGALAMHGGGVGDAPPPQQQHAFATAATTRAGPCYVTYWSRAVRLPRPPKDASGGPPPPPPELVTFPLDVRVHGDVRLSVFNLDALLQKRKVRAQSGLDPRLPFDLTPAAGWEALGEDVASLGTGRHSRADSESAAGAVGGGERIIAGEEAGCLFYCIFHTGFLGAEELLRVPLSAMDKAFKNKRGRYREEGVAVLRYTCGHAGEPAPKPVMAAAELAVPNERVVVEAV